MLLTVEGGRLFVPCPSSPPLKSGSLVPSSAHLDLGLKSLKEAPLRREPYPAGLRGVCIPLWHLVDINKVNKTDWLSPEADWVVLKLEPQGLSTNTASQPKKNKCFNICLIYTVFHQNLWVLFPFLSVVLL